MTAVHKTFCRFCHVFCGMEVDVDDAGRAVAVRGDKQNPVTRGYTCQKGRAELERLYHPERLLLPRTRSQRGEPWRAIEPSRALDEVADRLSQIVAQHGPDAVAVYTGCGGHRASAAGPWFVARWLRALGSQRMYTSYTIDSPSLTIAANRLFGGPLPVNLLDIERAECVMFVGTNPMASHQLNMPQSSPSARIKAAQRRGMKLIVIDPRRSDCARRADFFLQVEPGEDATLLAGMVKVVLDRGLQDEEYASKYLSGVPALHRALEGFDLEYVSRRTGVSKELIEGAAIAFAEARCGGAQSGTGMHMAPHHNLATQLVMTLNALCGRYDRPGGMNRNEGPLGPSFSSEMEAGPMRELPKTRIRNISAYNGLFGSYLEMPTNTLADEILTPGEGQIRALIVNGGNPALVLAEEGSALRALEELELLVVLDLFDSATAEYADYVFAMKHPFERADVSKLMDGTYPFPFGQYSAPIVEAGDGTLEEWEVFWELAMRLGIPLRIGDLGVDRKPSADELLDALNSRGRVPVEELRRHPGGEIFGEPTSVAGGVVPNLIRHPDKRMAVGHSAVLAELAEVRAEATAIGGADDESDDYRFRMITYRMKEVYCTQGQNLPSLRAKRPYNPVLMNPDVMKEMGLADGDGVSVRSQSGQVEGVVEGSDSLGPRTIAFAFGWGNPSDPRGPREKGSNVQRLISDSEAYDPSTGLARQSAIPVNVYPERNA